MVTTAFMRLVNAEEKPSDAMDVVNAPRCAGMGRGSVEPRALDVETGGLEPADEIVDRRRVAGFAFDLDHRVLGGQPGEDPAVVHLDDVGAGLEHLGGDRRE